MKKLFILALVTLVIASGIAYASDACIYGTAVYRDGSKSDGESTISTSWNSKKAYPKNGKYRLCLGSNPQKKITIYVNRKKYKELYVNGDTRLDIVIR
jgi:hypothetical protein